MVIPGSELSAAVRREAAQKLLRVAGGDASLIATIEGNQRLQAFRRENDPDHPLRAAGEFVERRRRQRQRLAEIFRCEIATAIGAVEQRLSSAIAERLEALPSLMPVPEHVSVNASARSTRQLSHASLRPPANEEERRRLAESTLLVSDYLREKIAEKHARLPPPERRELLHAIKTCFSTYVENLALGRDPSHPRVAQMSRAQPHYSSARDRPLMDEAWSATEPFRRERLRRIEAALKRPAVMKRPAAALER
jgi:hypothetical protein